MIKKDISKTLCVLKCKSFVSRTIKLYSRCLTKKENNPLPKESNLRLSNAPANQQKNRQIYNNIDAHWLEESSLKIRHLTLLRSQENHFSQNCFKIR